MDPSTIGENIQRYLEEAFPNPGVVLALETNLLDEYFLDSIAVIDVVDYIERTFGIEVRRADINGTVFENIRALSSFVARRMST
jgi:acyl carrier protein